MPACLCTDGHPGAPVDREDDGIPSSSADGDGPNDGDSVACLTPLRTNGTAVVEVLLSHAGHLHAWPDFNADGGRADADEQGVAVGERHRKVPFHCVTAIGSARGPRPESAPRRRPGAPAPGRRTSGGTRTGAAGPRPAGRGLQQAGNQIGGDVGQDVG